MFKYMYVDESGDLGQKEGCSKHIVISALLIDNPAPLERILEKKKLSSDFLKNDKNRCYNFVAGKLARNIILQGVDVEIRIDKSKGKQMLQEVYNVW